MLNRFLTSIFGSRNERVLRQLGKSVNQISALEPQYQALSDAELRAKTDEFRERLKNGAKLDSLLEERLCLLLTQRPEMCLRGGRVAVAHAAQRKAAHLQPGTP